MRWRTLFCCVFLFTLTLVWTVTGRCESLTFETVLDRAMDHAWEIKIARKEIDMSRSGLLESRSGYYPSFSLLFYNDYVYFLGNGKNVVSVGDQVSANTKSTYQNSFVLGLSWLVYDFGAREEKNDNAWREVRLAEFKENKTLIETRLKVLDSYARCVQLSRQAEATGEIVRLRKEAFRILRALREAGTIGRMRLDKAAVDLAEGLARQDDLEENLRQGLENLSYFTGREYARADTVFADLPPPPAVENTPNPEELPQVRIMDMEIEKAKAQRSIQIREMLPNISLTANYRMFGADLESYGRSVGSLSKRDATVALVLRWEFFNGFRDVARLNKLRYQVEQLQLERERQISDLRRQIRSADQGMQLNTSVEERLRERGSVLDQSAETLVRLSEPKVIDQVTFLEQAIGLLEQRMDMKVKTTQRRLAGWQLRFWSERRAQ